MKVIDFAAEVTKEVFLNLSMDYAEFWAAEEDYLEWYDCFSGMIDFNEMMDRIASYFPEIDFVLCVFPSSDPGWTEYEWKEGQWMQTWTSSETFGEDADECDMAGSFWAQRCKQRDA